MVSLRSQAGSLVLFLAVACIVVAINYDNLVGSSNSTIEVMDLPHVLTLLHQQKAVLIDARDPADYAFQHIAGAAQFADFGRAQMSGLTVAIFYCNNNICGRAYFAARDSLAILHCRVAVYTGGISEWESCGLPTAGSGRF